MQKTYVVLLDLLFFINMAANVFSALSDENTTSDMSNINNKSAIKLKGSGYIKIIIVIDINIDNKQFRLVL